jgi:hypothetical protein
MHGEQHSLYYQILSQSAQCCQAKLAEELLRWLQKFPNLWEEQGLRRPNLENDHSSAGKGAVQPG